MPSFDTLASKSSKKLILTPVRRPFRPPLELANAHPNGFKRLLVLLGCMELTKLQQQYSTAPWKISPFFITVPQFPPKGSIQSQSEVCLKAKHNSLNQISEFATNHSHKLSNPMVPSNNSPVLLEVLLS